MNTANISTINQTINGINSNISSINQDISDLESADTTLQTNINTVDGKVTLNTSNISTINSTIGTINTSLSSLTSRVTDLENNSSGGDDSSLQAQITLINASISTINSTIQSILSRITAIEQGTNFDLLYYSYSTDANINYGFTSGLLAGDYLTLDFSPYGRLKIFARLNTVPCQIDVKIKDTIKNEFVLFATPITYTGFYFLKCQLTTARNRLVVLRYSTFTFDSSTGTFDFVQGTAHSNFYIYRIEGYDKIEE